MSTILDKSGMCVGIWLFANFDIELGGKLRF